MEWKEYVIEPQILPTLRVEVNVHRIEQDFEELLEDASLEDILLAWVDYIVLHGNAGRETLVMKFLPQQ